MTDVAAPRSRSTTVALGTVRRRRGGVDIRPLSPLGAPSHAEYGRLKYGCGRAAARLGALLAERWWATAGPDTQVAPTLVCSSGYRVVPPAAQAMVGPFVERVRALAAEDGTVADLRPVRIRRDGLSPVDYALLPRERRLELMDACRLHLPPGVSAGPGDRVIVIDDARITGLHGERVAALFTGADVVHACLLVATERSDPRIEADLNRGWVRGIDHVVALAAEPTFVLNSRVCRYVLEDPHRVGPFVAGAPAAVVAALLARAGDDELGGLPAYAGGWRRLTKVVADRPDRAGKPLEGCVAGEEH